ncbi:hypothetical protein BU16DRAFT_583362 [Lophium mytilinum]|uniref:Uncharacterized protein n=1 Tax=Lophium mytilinum TaxID=390894 RepID=A0A6A6QQU6_9PEZI|nr:hypothetical protein BU16DRAFT_583362 [Lophium mytilinum]
MYARAASITQVARYAAHTGHGNPTTQSPGLAPSQPPWPSPAFIGSRVSARGASRLIVLSLLLGMCYGWALTRQPHMHTTHHHDGDPPSAMFLVTPARLDSTPYSRRAVTGIGESAWLLYAVVRETSARTWPVSRRKRGRLPDSGGHLRDFALRSSRGMRNGWVGENQRGSRPQSLIDISPRGTSPSAAASPRIRGVLLHVSPLETNRVCNK